METPTIQFKYALADDGEVVNITSLTLNDRRDYGCIGCGNIVRPVLGQIRRKHFRHKVNKECSFETYLHKMGKFLFEKNYKECLQQKLQFIIEYPVSVLCNHCKHGLCKITEEISKYDLTKVFRFIYLEKRDGNLIPDLRLETEGGDKIYVEIAVSNEAKIEKINSGVKIIEFKIEKEDDLHIFCQKRIPHSDSSIQLYNFRPKPIEKSIPSQCPKHKSYFVVYPNGKCSINTGKTYEFEEAKNKEWYVTEINYPSGMAFVEETEKAFKQGVQVKNCFLCRYHAVAKWFQRGDQDEPIFCKFYKESKQSNFASECEIYRPDPNVFKNA